MNMVFERYPSGGGEMLLALALADHSHDDGTNIYPSIAQLATKTRQSERAVQYQLRRMEDTGWIELVNEGDGGRGRRREYRINRAWMKGEEIAPITPTKGANAAPIEKGATDDKKGANGDAKGCKAVAPTDNRKESSKNHQADVASEPQPYEGFDAFWRQWPKHHRKSAKAQCREKWRTQGCAKLTAQVITSLERWKTSDEWLQARGKFIPAPMVWLNQSRWEAELDAAPLTVTSDGAEKTRAMLASRELTPEEKVAADAAAARFVEQHRLRKVAA